MRNYRRRRRSRLRPWMLAIGGIVLQRRLARNRRWGKRRAGWQSVALGLALRRFSYMSPALLALRYGSRIVRGRA